MERDVVKALLSQKLFRFLVVGLSNTLISYVAFVLLLHLLRTAFVAQALAYAAGVAWSYFWNSRWTFEQSSNSRAQFARFVASQLALLVASALLLGLTVDLMALNATASWIAVMIVITAANYLIAKSWVFADRDASRPERANG